MLPWKQILKSATGAVVGAGLGKFLIPANNPDAGIATGIALGLYAPSTIEWVMNHPDYRVRITGQVWMTLASLTLVAVRLNAPLAIIPIYMLSHGIDTPTGQTWINSAWQAIGGQGVAQENLHPNMPRLQQ
ncbi:MAG TPA: hypothetical protein VI522_01785 [Gammaproteobacteria bacterium]|nr:hypothetical protein [Gammaproteobacteria bacterium]